MDLSSKFEKIKENYSLLFKAPKIELSLEYSKVEGKDPFYERVTLNFFELVNKRRKKMPLFRQMTRGVAVCNLQNSFDSYLKSIESSGRRNIKKANRLGYTFKKITYNDYTDGIWEIRRSTSMRQGKVSDNFMNDKPKPNKDPVPKSNTHGYPYFGVFDSEDKLVAYAGCFLAGEVIELSHFYGHAEHQKNGVVPLLITSIADYVITNHPGVKVFLYGGYVGASPTLRRFKKKFQFMPHQVKWILR